MILESPSRRFSGRQSTNYYRVPLSVSVLWIFHEGADCSLDIVTCLFPMAQCIGINNYCIYIFKIPVFSVSAISSTNGLWNPSISVQVALWSLFVLLLIVLGLLTGRCIVLYDGYVCHCDSLKVVGNCKLVTKDGFILMYVIYYRWNSTLSAARIVFYLCRCASFSL